MVCGGQFPPQDCRWIIFRVRLVVPPLQGWLQAAQTLHSPTLQLVGGQLNFRLLRRLQEFEGVKMTATTASTSIRVPQRVMARKQIKTFPRVCSLEGGR